MNLPASNNDDYSTGNRELVIYLKIMGVNPRCNSSVGRRKIFTYSRTAISERGLDKMWQSGDALMVDLRDVFKAEAWFNSMVHDEL